VLLKTIRLQKNSDVDYVLESTIFHGVLSKAAWMLLK